VTARVRRNENGISSVKNRVGKSSRDDDDRIPTPCCSRAQVVLLLDGGPTANHAVTFFFFFHEQLKIIARRQQQDTYIIVTRRANRKRRLQNNNYRRKKKKKIVTKSRVPANISGRVAAGSWLFTGNERTVRGFGNERRTTDDATITREIDGRLTVGRKKVESAFDRIGRSRRSGLRGSETAGACSPTSPTLRKSRHKNAYGKIKRFNVDYKYIYMYRVLSIRTLELYQVITAMSTKLCLSNFL